MLSNISLTGLLKYAIVSYAEDFINYFLPSLAPQLDFSITPASLELELETFFPIPQEEKLTLKILKMHSKNKNTNTKKKKLEEEEGDPVFIQIALQESLDTNFNQRMLSYFTRIYDNYGTQITGLALLIDTQPDFFPTPPEKETADGRAAFQYSTYKLIAKTPEEFSSAADTNIFSIFMWIARLGLEKPKKTVRLEQILEILHALERLQYSADKMKWMFFYMIYYFKFNDKKLVEDIGKLVAALFPPFEGLKFVDEAINWEWHYGYHKGLDQGKVKGKRDAIHRAFNIKEMSDETIANVFGVTLEFVKRYRLTFEQQQEKGA